MCADRKVITSEKDVVEWVLAQLARSRDGTEALSKLSSNSQCTRILRQKYGNSPWKKFFDANGDVLVRCPTNPDRVCCLENKIRESTLNNGVTKNELEKKPWVQNKDVNNQYKNIPVQNKNNQDKNIPVQNKNNQDKNIPAQNKNNQDKNIPAQKKENNQDKNAPVQNKKENNQDKNIPAQNKKENNQDKNAPVQNKKEYHQDRNIPVQNKKENNNQDKNIPVQNKKENNNQDKNVPVQNKKENNNQDKNVPVQNKKENNKDKNAPVQIKENMQNDKPNYGLQNWLHLVKILKFAEESVRECFHHRWEQETGTKWTDDKVAADAFKKRFPNCYAVFSYTEQKDIFNNGDSKKWDISLLRALLCRVEWKLNDKINTQNTSIKQIVDIRNFVFHTTTIDQNTFKQFWDTLRQVLVEKLGVDATRLDYIQLDEGGSTLIDDEITKHAEQLKEKSNKLYQQQQYDEAIQGYTQAIELGGYIPEVLLSQLYSNRSAAYVLLVKSSFSDKNEKFLTMAKSDAKHACILTPNNGKAHYRLGHVLSIQGKYSKACLALERAAVCLPDDPLITNALSDARFRNGQQHRHESQNTNYVPGGRATEMMEELSTRMGTTPTNIQKIIDKLPQMSGSPLMVAKGHVIQALQLMKNYNTHAEAVAQFTRAAELGDPEGMYNLAVCLQNGRGCARNMEEAMNWFNKAAACPTTILGQRNIGVAEALHSLGLRYYEGVGVEKDRQKSFSLWKQAAELGLAQGENSLGTLYEAGEIVKQDFVKAMQLYKSAAEKGEAQAMANVAIMYANGQGVAIDFSKAAKWAQSAVDHGATHVRQLLEDFKKKVSIPPISTTDGTPFSKLHQLHNLPEPTPTFITSKVYEPQELEKIGTPYALQLLTAINLIVHATMLWKNGQTMEALSVLAEAICIPDSELVLSYAPTELLDFGGHVSNQNPNAKDAAIVRAYGLVRKNKMEATIFFIKLCIKRFPQESFFPYLCGSMMCFSGPCNDFNEAIRLFHLTAKLLPSNSYIHYSLATAKRMIGQYEQSSQHYKKFIALAVQGHRKIPEAYYGLALNEFKKNIELTRLYFQQGKEAEASLPPLFQPHNSINKKLLNELINLTTPVTIEKTKSKNKSDATSFSPSNPLPPINLLKRQKLVTELRRARIVVAENMKTTYCKTTVVGKQSPAFLPDRSKLIPITLEDMIVPRKDNIYKDHILHCIVIAHPVKINALRTLIIDKSGDILGLALYNLSPADSAKVTVGRKLNIIHPYFRLTMTKENMIRVDEPKTIQFDELVPRCWYCLCEAEKLFVCAKCKCAQYCSKSCQRSDWNELDHKLECTAQGTLGTSS